MDKILTGAPSITETAARCPVIQSVGVLAAVVLEDQAGQRQGA